MAEQPNARKTFRLDEAAQAVLAEQQRRGGGSENDTLNRLLTGIPQQEQELQQQLLKRQQAETKIKEWQQQYNQLQATHDALVQALQLVGATLLPPPLPAAGNGTGTGQ